MNNNDVEMKVKEIQNWLKTQPQLPQCIEDNLVKRFIFSMYGDMKRTKRFIDIHYKFRGKYHRIFMKRDPHDPISQKVLKAIDFIELPGKTQENCNILLYRINDPKAFKFSFADAIKVYFMMTDCQYSRKFDEDTEGEVLIIDMKDFNLQNLARINVLTSKSFLKILAEAHPVRIKQIHFLNSPSYLQKFMKFSVQALYFNKMHFHSPNKDNLDKFCLRHMLPMEYGGQAGELSNLRKFWLSQLYEKRKYLMDDTIW